MMAFNERERFKWLAMRFAAPLIITAAIIRATQGYNFFDIFGPLVWSLLATHLVATFAFSRTHLLDTGSFFCLIFASGNAAVIGERGLQYNFSSWFIFGAFYGVYLILSLIGRLRADRLPPGGRSVSIEHVVAALSVLFVAVIVCSFSKVAVGFLFVPGLLIIPFLLFWSLLSRR